MHRDAYDKLGRSYKAEYRRGMDEGDWAVIDSTQSVGIKLLEIRNNELSQLNRALRKLEEGSYGICEECGDEISEARLKVRPVTTLCINCKMEAEQKERRP